MNLINKISDTEFKVSYKRLKKLDNEGEFNYFPLAGWDKNYTAKTKIKKIGFDVGRFMKYKFIIKFPKKITIWEAVKTVEKYMSLPITEEYYEMIKDGCFEGNYKLRGDCLGELRWLSGVEEKNGIHFIHCAT